MSMYDTDTKDRDTIAPATETEGGIRNNDAEQSESSKLQNLEDMYHRPSVTPAERAANQPNSGNRFVQVGKKLQRKSSLATIILLLFGGGGFLTVFFTPTLALNQLTAVMTESLNDQFKAVDARSEKLLEVKVNNLTKGSCGLVKVPLMPCRLGNMSDSQAKKFKAAGIDVEREPSKLFPKSGTITKMTFTNEAGQKTIITSGEQLHKMSLENIEFQAAKTKGFNPWFASLKDSVTDRVLNRLKTKRTPITGDTDEERQKRLNDAASGVEDGNARPLTETEDKDGKKSYSVDGESVSAGQVDDAKSLASRLTDLKNNTSFVKGVTRSISVLGAAQTVCGLRTMLSVTSNLMQVEKMAQAARFAIEGPAATSDGSRAGQVKAEDVDFMANKATTMTTEDTVTINADGSKTTGTKTGNAFDSEGYQWAAYKTAPESLSVGASKFMLAGGTPSILDKTLDAFSPVVNKDTCKIVNNPLVSLGAVGIGIVLGVGSGGAVTAATAAGTTALSMAEPYLETQIAHTLSANAFKDLAGQGFGNGTYGGLTSFLGLTARSRGMQPLNASKGVKYLEKNMAATVGYNETQSYIARATPFDINNRFSFLGSIVYSLSPTVEKSKTSAGAAMMSMINILPTTLATLTPQAKAFPANYFQCNDPYFKQIGIDAGFFCEVRYGMTDEELEMDPVANAQWMLDSGNIDPDSQTGEAKDNGQAWNYVKFLDECVNRTNGWGMSDENGDGDGSNCVKDENEEVNKHFRVYTMDKTVNESMDEESQTYNPDDTTYTDGRNGKPNVDGWAYPAPAGAATSTTYGSGEGREKNGVTITMPNGGDTAGMAVFAAYEGTVTASGKDSVLGNRIIIESWINGALVSTVYGHLGDNSLIVKTGDKVKSGQEIAIIGSSGDDPPRLYFELWSGPTSTGQPVDPTQTLEATKKTAEASSG